MSNSEDDVNFRDEIGRNATVEKTIKGEKVPFANTLGLRKILYEHCVNDDGTLWYNAPAIKQPRDIRKPINIFKGWIKDTKAENK